MSTQRDHQPGQSESHEPRARPRPATTGSAAGRSAPPRAAAPYPGLVRMLRGVLSDLDYPAQRWQIVVAAESYGADSFTVARLTRLPRASYPSIEHIAHAYTHATGAPAATELSSRA